MSSYRLVLDEDDDLVWITQVDGAETRYYKYLEFTFGQRQAKTGCS